MDSPYVVALLAVFLAWATLSAWVLLDRALYDRLVSGLRKGSRGHRLPWRTVARIAADSSSDPELAGALVRYVLETDEPGVVAAAQDPRAGWRGVEAVRILALAGHPLSLPALERLLRVGDEEVCAAAVTILADVEDEQSTSLLLEALRTGVCPTRLPSAILDRRAVPFRRLEPLLDHPRPDVRAVATRLLGNADGADPGIDQILLGLCHDPEADVRAAACRALGERGNAAAVPQLESMLADPVWFVQVRAARALGQLHSLGSAGKLAELLAARRWWVRQAAKEALVELGPATKTQLEPLLDHADPFARNSCAEVFQNLGVVDDLVAEAKESPDPIRASAAADLLRRIVEAGGSRVEEAVLALPPDVPEQRADSPEIRAA